MPDDTFASLLVTALDTADDDPVRLQLLLQMMLMDGDNARATALDRLRHEGIPASTPRL